MIRIRLHKYRYIHTCSKTNDLFPSYGNMYAEEVSVHGPITQSQFLGALGINFRVESLLQNCTEEQAESLRTGYWRLVGDGEAPFWEGDEDNAPIGMGSRYKAMAIVNKNQGAPVPFQ